MGLNGINSVLILYLAFMEGSENGSRMGGKGV